ncbi:ATP-binding protein [Alkalihalobacterium chitinilyticum]|uniref:histidine kinase n=1 Tax=Alkalihalobacterium chitinilyticum TaxID=2980103 RepID=A0ABT5VGQ4_9BACI|nr:ATP-binding protein [Alkalihalobacterium chitinilyticum]MDE5414637.1 ATP-binding protein [Alkalihalobacterium chitinilyticum]
MGIDKHKRLDLIFKRNQLMAKLLMIFYASSIVINTFIDPVILVFVAPIGLFFCILIYFLSKQKQLTILTMYLSILFVFSFFFLLIIYEPLLINFIYIWLGLIISSIFHMVRPILFASFLTTAATIYFFFRYQNELFPGSDKVDVIYVALFGILITIFLVFSSRFTEGLLEKAQLKTEKTSKALIEAKGYLNTLFNQLKDPIVIHDEKGRIYQVNHGFTETFGWNTEELVGQTMPQLNEVQLKYLQEQWESVSRGEMVREIELKNGTKDEKQLDVAISVSAIRTEEGRVVALASILRDITEQKQTEEYIRRSEKLSAVGQLAAGVAHEIRNPLTVISGFLQLMQQREQNTNNHVPVMLSELARINKIISEFLLLAKPGVQKFENVKICYLIREVVTLLDTSAIMKSISITSEFSIDDTTVECDPDQIKQVLINLLKNSIEAMDDGGQIHIHVYEKDNMIYIQIKDTGNGIPQEVLERIGEPFFTTKPKGTGLGLMICDRIIEHHHGKMDISSVQGKGTTVTIYLNKVISEQEGKNEYTSSEYYRESRTATERNEVRSG